MNRPLLVVDGDSFAHRSYHAVPKSIRRKGDRGAGAIVGFANFLLRLYDSEQPRAVLVGWDTLGAPTYRQKLFPAYQGGRGDRMVRRAEWAAFPVLKAKAAGAERGERGRFQRFLAAHRRQQSRETRGQHRFPGSRGPDHQHAVTSRGGDFERALRVRLPFHFREIRIVRWDDGRLRRRPRQRLPAGQMSADLK